MTTRKITIDIVHTAADEHCLTAYDAEGAAICSLWADNRGIGEGQDGERIESLGEWTGDVDSEHGALHTAMYALIDQIECE